MSDFITRTELAALVNTVADDIEKLGGPAISARTAFSMFADRLAPAKAEEPAAPPPGVEEVKRGPWSICSRCEGEDPTCYIHGEPGVEEDKPLTCPPDKCNCFGPSMTPCPIHPYKPAAFCKSDAEDIVAKCEQWFDIGKHPDGPEFRATMGWIYERAKRLAARDGERSQPPAPEVRPMSMLDRARSFEAVEGDA